MGMVWIVVYHILTACKLMRVAFPRKADLFRHPGLDLKFHCFNNGYLSEGGGRGYLVLHSELILQ